MGKLNNQQVIQSLTSVFGDRISVPSEPFGLLTFETSSIYISLIQISKKLTKKLFCNERTGEYKIMAGSSLQNIHLACSYII
ncbi:MAG: hypothetical protein HGA25_04030 [Clostridiales bacterium]|nr:hypothetical protein [Clostridiales bacterium]